MNRITELTDTLSLIERKDGFWLYDSTRGMNLSMRAKSAQAAFIEALTYYQNRLSVLEADHAYLLGQVNAFVECVK